MFKWQILTHSVQFLDTLYLHATKMIKKILYILIQPRVSVHMDAKTWVQKILLEEKYGKINS